MQYPWDFHDTRTCFSSSLQPTVGYKCLNLFFEVSFVKKLYKTKICISFSLYKGRIVGRPVRASTWHSSSFDRLSAKIIPCVNIISRLGNSRAGVGGKGELPSQSSKSILCWCSFSRLSLCCYRIYFSSIFHGGVICPHSPSATLFRS